MIAAAMSVVGCMKSYRESDGTEELGLKMGDVARGAKIFKTKCAQCHVVGAGNTIPHFLP